MTFTYNGVELEIIDDFCYLGVNLRFNLDPQWHLDAMFRRAKSSTVAIFSKLNARKMSFPVAKRLFDCAVNPVSMYGVSVFQQSLDRSLIDRHCMAVLGFYWKKWCGVPQCLRTTNIVSAIYMGTELTRSYDRKRVALAYAFSNGYHHLFCSAHNHPSNLPLNDCRCSYCGKHCNFMDHFTQCTSVPGLTFDEKAVSLLRYQNRPTL